MNYPLRYYKPEYVYLEFDELTKCYSVESIRTNNIITSKYIEFNENLITAEYIIRLCQENLQDLLKYNPHFYLRKVSLKRSSESPLTSSWGFAIFER